VCKPAAEGGDSIKPGASAPGNVVDTVEAPQAGDSACRTSGNFIHLQALSSKIVLLLTIVNNGRKIIVIN
jgi:hypothetical protein